MILDKYVIVTLNSNQMFDAIKYWTDKGYTDLVPQQKLKVKVSELPKFSGAMILFKCDCCGIEWKCRYSKRFAKKTLYEEDYCWSCSRKITGARQDRTKTIEQLKTRCGPKHHNWNPNKLEFQTYAYQVRQLTEVTYTKHKNLINPDYHLRTLCGISGGYQLDHKISIKEGFKKQIPPEQLAKPDNLQMLPWHINRTKWA